MKLRLPSVTLVCVDGVNANRAIAVLENCKKKCDFGAVKLLTHIPCSYEHKIDIIPLNSLIEYSIFMLTRIHQYIDTEHLLVVQRDGFILNPQSFKEEWLKNDWTSPLFVQYPKVGSGGFSLRTKKMMVEIADSVPRWDGTPKQANEIQDILGYYEDGVCCLSSRASRFKIATLEQACEFAQGGNRDSRYYQPYPFGFHGLWAKIDFETGKVSPVCEHEQGNCECVQPTKLFLREMES